jgi:hypothetical protein
VHLKLNEVKEMLRYDHSHILMPPKDGSQLAVILPLSVVVDGRNQLREIYDGDQQTQTTSSETMPKFSGDTYYQSFSSLECSWLTKTS